MTHGTGNSLTRRGFWRMATAGALLGPRVVRGSAPQTAAAGRRTLCFEPAGPGFVRLTVIDQKGATDSVMVRLQ